MKPAEPTKADVALSWIALGLVRIHFDATFESHVKVPRHLCTKQHCVVEFGFDLPKPIPDLKIDQLGISGTLSYDGFSPEWTSVDWEAVFCIGSPAQDRVALWLNDAPASVQREILQIAGEQANAKIKQTRKKPGLTIVTDGKKPKKHKFSVIQGGKK